MLSASVCRGKMLTLTEPFILPDDIGNALWVSNESFAELLERTS